ncbi:MAG: TIGR01244 family sulfur transferase [Sphingomonadales bacterium]
MGEFKTIDEGFFVSGQIFENDLDIAKARGVTLIICNRPDNEDPNQPSSEVVKDWAEVRGMNFKNIPVTVTNIDLKAISEFGILLTEAEGSVLAYCRSGMRSCTLWALAHAAVDDLTNEEILTTAKLAGYDLGAMITGLESVRKTTRVEMS